MEGITMLKIKRSISIAIVLLISLCSFNFIALADGEDVSVLIYGKEIEADIPSIVVNNKVLVQLEAVVKALSLNCKLNKEEKSVCD
jgi:hypothetical protein